MATGRKLTQGVGTVTIPPLDGENSCIHRIRLETSASFDRTITIKKRPRQNVGETVLTALAAWYKKESDGAVASAALTPGASNKSEYTVDGVGGYVDIDVTGGTAGTVDIYWSTDRA